MSRRARIDSVLARRFAPVVVLVVLVVLMSGCTVVRDFLIPPAEVGTQAGHTIARADAAHLILNDVMISGKKRVSVAIRAGRVLAVGSRAQLAKRADDGTVVIEGAGGVLTPGLVDGHVHLEGWALLGDAVDLRDVQTVAALVVALKQRVGFVSSGGWLWGFGLSPALAQQLSAAQLERAVPGLPVWLSGADGHSAVLSAALVARLPGPMASGAATGHLAEAAARRAWYALPPPAGERLKAFLVQALRGLGARGLTTVHVMGARPALQTTLEELDAAGRLRVRCRLYLAWSAPTTSTWLRRKIHARASRRRASAPLMTAAATPTRSIASRLVDVVGVKVWLDGTLGSRTASLSGPYADRPNQPPAQPLMSVAELRQVIGQVDQAHVQLAVHIIGDAALDRLLAALDGWHRPSGSLPIRIEHAQVVRPDQLLRLAARTDVLCSVQPMHRMADAAWSAARLGTARIDWGYRAASLNRVCPLIAGSDAPVTPPTPWRAMLAVTQHSRVTERMSAAEAWAAHTRDPLTGRPRQVTVGAPADLVLWSTAPTVGRATPPVVKTIILGGAQMRP